MKHDEGEIRGVLDGGRALVGPRFVEICITNRCNTDCIMCWGHSPFLDDGAHRRSNWDRNQQLPLERMTRFLEELAQLGTREVLFAGGGDPLMYDGIFELLSRTNELGMDARLLTNFILLSEARRDALLATGVRTIQVSLLAASREAYHAIHPNQPPATFDRLVDDLDWMIANRDGPGRPFLLHGHVICNRNDHELAAMFDLARRSGDGITLVPMDPITGSTDQFLLTADQLAQVHQDLARIADDYHRRWEVGEHQFEWRGWQDFERRLSAPRAAEGIYDVAPVGGLPPCTIGWTYARVEADGSVCSCCKATRTSLGNLLDQPFSEIWFGDSQNGFRTWSDARPPDPRFSSIHCELTCDNIGHNREMEQRLERHRR